MPLAARTFAFGAVGATCLGLNTFVLWALVSGLNVHYLVATMIAFTAITPLGYLMNKVLTFRTHRKHAVVELPRYFLAMTASFVANIVLMYLLVSVLGLWYLPASLLVAATLVIVNFLTSDRWSFRAER